MRDFHNLYVKKALIQGVSKKGSNLIDFACGKAGDIHKWLHLKIKHVFGIDNSKDNIINAEDGCYARYLSQCFFYDPAKKEMKKKKQYSTSCLFVHGDLSKDLLKGDATYTKEDYEIVTKEKMPYDICSCQFAIHYFFKDKKSIEGFLNNVHNVVKMGGHFVGCCFDGESVFEKLRGRPEINCNDSDGNRIWCLRKGYKETDKFPEGKSSLGMKITVFQESINTFIDEYLVNFDYLVEMMEMIGFFLVKDEMFESCYDESFELSEIEREISFLNRSFVFQKKTKVSSV
jgi:SAM-dependent methyltransferase